MSCSSNQVILRIEGQETSALLTEKYKRADNYVFSQTGWCYFKVTAGHRD